MKTPILDDSTNTPMIIFTKDKTVAYLSILVSFFYMYNALTGWHAYHYPSALVLFLPPEIAYPMRLLSGILISFCGIQLLLKKMTFKFTLIASILIFITNEFIILSIAS